MQTIGFLLLIGGLPLVGVGILSKKKHCLRPLYPWESRLTDWEPTLQLAIPGGGMILIGVMFLLIN